MWTVYKSAEPDRALAGFWLAPRPSARSWGRCVVAWAHFPGRVRSRWLCAFPSFVRLVSRTTCFIPLLPRLPCILLFLPHGHQSAKLNGLYTYVTSVKLFCVVNSTNKRFCVSNLAAWLIFWRFEKTEHWKLITQFIGKSLLLILLLFKPLILVHLNLMRFDIGTKEANAGSQKA